MSKYTGMTREEVKGLNEEFRKMDTRTPTEKLNALAADAGRIIKKIRPLERPARIYAFSAEFRTY